MSHGIYRDANVSELAAWQLALPAGGRFTHLTAAGALGWWLPPLPADLPVLAAVPSHSMRPARQGMRVVRADPAVAPREQQGISLDAPAEILLNCARDLSLLDLVVLIDGALHRGDVSTDQLHEIAAVRRRGNRALRAALPLADARSESPWESVLRLMHLVCGAAVEPQWELRTDDGDFVARADLWVVGTRAIHEYDGGVHLERVQQQADLTRARRLADAGWVRRGYTSRDLVRRPIGILRDIDRALDRSHDPSRIREWHALLAESLFTRAGSQRLLTKLRGKQSAAKGANSAGSASSAAE